MCAIQFTFICDIMQWPSCTIFCWALKLNFYFVLKGMQRNMLGPVWGLFYKKYIYWWNVVSSGSCSTSRRLVGSENWLVLVWCWWRLWMLLQKASKFVCQSANDLSSQLVVSLIRLLLSKVLTLQVSNW